MGISRALATEHVQVWSNNFRSYERKKKWPSHIFHACHVTTAVEILQDGQVVCRNGVGVVRHDVANQGALNNNCAMHDYCRFYFRPRNMFHLKTEGIKAIGDINRPANGEQQMSVPILFAFDSLETLAMNATRFTRGMGSRANEEIGDGDDFFRGINFDYVYHDEYTQASVGDAIRAARMAEILIPNTLPLNHALRQIICRTTLDMETLKSHLPSEIWNNYKQIITVEQISGSCFQRKGAHIENVYFESNGSFRLILKLAEVAPISGCYSVSILRAGGRRMNWTLPRPTTSPQSVRLAGVALEVNEIIEIFVEDTLAFRGAVPMQSGLLTV